MMHPRVAILASGEGTTAEAFIKASVDGKINAQAELIISNNQNAGIFGRIATLNKKYGLNIESVYISKQNYPATDDEDLRPGEQTKAEEQAILKTLSAKNFDAIALMGYMKKVGPQLVYEFGWRPGYKSPYQARMLNTHPGLLPATKGLYGIHVQEYVLENKLDHAGQTLHIVAEDYDEGPQVVEHKIIVRNNETPDELFKKIKRIEKKFLPKDIDNFIKARQKYLSEKGNM